MSGFTTVVVVSLLMVTMHLNCADAFGFAHSQLRTAPKTTSGTSCSILMSEKVSTFIHDVYDKDTLEAQSAKSATSRRAVLGSFMLWPILQESAYATTGSVKTSQYSGASSSRRSKIKPEAAFRGLIQARDELQRASETYIAKKDYDGLRTFLSEDAENINNFEENALAILASKKLDDEDKKAIGTIRRYGVGADVLIMYGGLLAEIDESNDEPDGDTVQKYLTRTIESLDEVIAICRNGGFDG